MWAARKLSGQRAAGSRLRRRALAAALVALGSLLISSPSAFAGVTTGQPRSVVRAPSASADFRAFSVTASAPANPATNRAPSDATMQNCQASPEGSACVDSALADINAARAAEGVAPMVLPIDFTTLTVPQQLLVLANLERVNRGLAPIGGLSANLDSVAAGAAVQAADANPSQFNGDVFTSNWAGGTDSS